MAKGATLSKLLIYIDTGYSFKDKQQAKIKPKIEVSRAAERLIQARIIAIELI